MDSYWAVAQTEPNREVQAVEGLERRSHLGYCPLVMVGRVKEKRRPRPLFPGYILVRVAGAWYSIKQSWGITRLLMNRDAPAKLSDEFVDKLQARERDGVIQLPAAPRFKRGERVLIAKGPLAGMLGLYDGPGLGQCERVLLNLLGRMSPTNVPIDDLESVS